MAVVLAVEPDPRQAAILERVVRRRVRAEFVLTDSKDAAIAAIERQVPDLILVTALLSPPDEAELTEHLRGLDGAGHLQTLTIPLLASLDREDPPQNHGLLGAFRRRRKKTKPKGADPAVFADEIRGYLERAGEARAETRRPVAIDEHSAAEPHPKTSGSPALAVEDMTGNSVTAPVLETGAPAVAVDVFSRHAEPLSRRADAEAELEEQPPEARGVDAAPLFSLAPVPALNDESVGPVETGFVDEVTVEAPAGSSVLVDEPAIEAALLPVPVGTAPIVEVESAAETTGMEEPETWSAVDAWSVLAPVPALDDESVAPVETAFVDETTMETPAASSVLVDEPATEAAIEEASPMEGGPAAEAVLADVPDLREEPDSATALPSLDRGLAAPPPADSFDPESDRSTFDNVVAEIETIPFTMIAAPLEACEEPEVADLPAPEAPAPAGDDLEVREPVAVWTQPASLMAEVEEITLTAGEEIDTLDRAGEIGAPPSSPSATALPPPAPPTTIFGRWIASALDALRTDIQLLREDRRAESVANVTASPDPGRDRAEVPTDAPRPTLATEAPELDDLAAADHANRRARRTRRAKRKERTDGPASPRPVQDEWGLYDPARCGLEALFAKIDGGEEAQDPTDDYDQTDAFDRAGSNDGRASVDLVPVDEAAMWAAPDTTAEPRTDTPVTRPRRHPATAPDWQPRRPVRGMVHAPLALWARMVDAPLAPDRSIDGLLNDDGWPRSLAMFASSVPDDGDNLRGLLHGLNVPSDVAAVAYVDRCRIGHVRIARAKGAHRSHGARLPVIVLSKKLLRQFRSERGLPTAQR